MILNRYIDQHTEAFEELDTAISSMTDRNVILNAQSCKRLEQLPPGVIFNLENVPLQVDMGRYRGLNRTIWDFSEENLLSYPGDVHAVHVPIGYHPTMTRFAMKPKPERDIDVLYYGATSARRKAIYDALRSRGLRVETCFEYGTWRDQMIARSKCVAVIPYLAPYVFPVLRAAHLVANQVPIVAEAGIEVPSWVRKSYLYDELVEAIVDVVTWGDPDTANRLRDFQFQPMMLPA